MVSSQARSRPAEAHDFGINEVLRRHHDTHLVQRQLMTGVEPQQLSPRGSPSRPSRRLETQLWVPGFSQPSISSVTTRESQSLFDTRGPQSCATSISEETDASSLPGSDTASEHNQVPNVLENEETIPCEFAGYTHCERRFGINQIQRWLDHVTGFHLQGCLPQVTVCWFCDERRFTTTSNLDVDKAACLRQRMYHIVGHLREAQRPNDLRIRPDFPFFEHIASRRLISQEVINHATSYSEMPAEYQLATDTAPPPRTRPRHNVIVENNQSNGRRRRGVQQYAL